MNLNEIIKRPPSIYGSKKIKLSKNKFLNATAATKLAAIRLETTTKSKTLYPLRWSAADRTANTVIQMTANTFTSQFSAIRTLDYLKGKTHSKINLSQNKFTKIKDTTIYMTAWKSPQMTKNTFDGTKMKAEEAIIARGVSQPTIKQNTFIQTKNIISFRAIYLNEKLFLADIANIVTAKNKKDLANNTGGKTKKSDCFITEK